MSQNEENEAKKLIDSYPVHIGSFQGSDGAKICYRYREHKNPKAILFFVHGYPTTWFIWWNQLSHFYNKGYTVVAMDQRGYGDSEKFLSPFRYSIDQLVSDLSDLVNIFDKDVPKIMVCHDWGGLVANEYRASF